MKPISFDIPVFNEEEILVQNIEKLIRRCNEQRISYEIIIVSNGSTDRSAILGAELEKKYPQVRFFSLPQKGVGRAFRKAAQEAKFNHIISLDIDLSTDLSFIEKANRLLENYSMVIGSKIAGSQRRSLLRKIGSGIYILFTKLFFRLSLNDFSIGAKGYRRDFVLKNLGWVDDHTSYVLNLAFVAAKNNKKIVEIPVECVDLRQSRFNLLAEALYRFYMLFRLALGASPGAK